MKQIFVNENVSYDASEGANCKWKFSVWSTELFLCSRPSTEIVIAISAFIYLHTHLSNAISLPPCESRKKHGNCIRINNFKYAEF